MLCWRFQACGILPRYVWDYVFSFKRVSEINFRFDFEQETQYLFYQRKRVSAVHSVAIVSAFKLFC